MGNCLDCEWDISTIKGKRDTFCLQGRARTPPKKIIENCYDHKKKEKCRWCEGWRYLCINFDKDIEFDNIARYLITLDRPMTECPVCGRKLEG